MSDRRFWLKSVGAAEEGLEQAEDWTDTAPQELHEVHFPDKGKPVSEWATTSFTTPRARATSSASVEAFTPPTKDSGEKQWRSPALPSAASDHHRPRWWLTSLDAISQRPPTQSARVGATAVAHQRHRRRVSARPPCARRGFRPRSRRPFLSLVQFRDAASTRPAGGGTDRGSTRSLRNSRRRGAPWLT